MAATSGRAARLLGVHRVKACLHTILLCLLVSPAVGQARLEGRVLELGFDDGLGNASIVATSLADTSQTVGASSDRRGFFDLRTSWSGRTLIRISHVGFRAFQDTLRVDGRSNVGVITLVPEIVDLDEVEVSARRERMTINGDTVEFFAGGFYVPRYTYAENLVATLPGFEIIGGTVHYLGRPVDRVLIDGKAYFGTEVMEALQSMPIEMIETLQLYEQLPENRRFSGVDDGSREQVINLVTDPNKRRALMLEASGSGGSADRYGLEAGANLLDAPLQVSGNLSTDNTSTSAGAGISRTDRARVGYNNTWNENTRVRMTVVSSQRTTETEQEVSRTYLAQEETPTTYDERRSSESDVLSHTLSGSVRHTIGRHQLTFNPRLLLMDSAMRSSLDGASLDPISMTPRSVLTGLDGSSASLTGGLSTDWQLNNAGTWGMLASLNLSFSDDSGESLQTSSFDPTSSFLQTTEDSFESRDFSLDLSAGMMRAVGENGFLSLDISQAASNRVEDRLAFSQRPGDLVAALDSTLSNDHEGSSTSTGLNIHYGHHASGRGWDLSVGANRNVRSFSQRFPDPDELTRVDYLVNVSASRSQTIEDLGRMSLEYSASGSTPSGDELSRAVNNSNPLFLSVGNPDILATIRHQASARVSLRKPEASWGGGGNILLRLVQNPVGTEALYAGADDRVILGILVPAGGQLSRSVNLDTERSAQVSMNMSRFGSRRAGNLNLHLSANLTDRPVAFDDGRFRTSTRAGNFSASWHRPLGEAGRLGANYQVSLSSVDSDVALPTSSSHLSHQGSIQASGRTQGGFELSSSFSANAFERFDSDFDSRSFNLSASLGYRPVSLEQLQISVSLNDILDSAADLQRSTSELYLESTRSRQLGRHLLFNISWQFRKFSPGRS